MTEIDGDRMFGLSGLVAVVTGARQGIGASIARGFADAGADVVVTSRRVEELHATVEAVERSGGNVIPAALDLADEASIEQLVSTVLRDLGHVDVLVNNAGVTARSTVLSTSVADWKSVVEINLIGSLAMARAVAPTMAASGGGSIINVTSVSAVTALPNRSAYAVSKAGIEHLTRVLAVEWAADGIRVNSIMPGSVLTDSRAPTFADPAVREARLSHTPLGRFATPDELVGPAVFLASHASSYVTGATIAVDGGFTII